MARKAGRPKLAGNVKMKHRIQCYLDAAEHRAFQTARANAKMTESSFIRAALHVFIRSIATVPPTDASELFGITPEQAAVIALLKKPLPSDN